MRFGDLSPADRMRASALIGLIVVLLFFVVNTMLGALSPKKGPNPGGKPAPVTASGPESPMDAEPAPATTASDSALPMGPAGAGKRTAMTDALGLDIHDPFVPIRDDKARSGPARQAGSSPAPGVQVRPVGMAGLPPIGPMSPMLGPVGGPGGAPGPSVQPLAVAPPPEPEIRLIGVVHGDPSVATLQVDGRVTLARPGDGLSKGYRLFRVYPEGVLVRHAGEIMVLHVGQGVNQPRAAAAGGRS